MDCRAVTFSIYRAKTAGGATAAPAEGRFEEFTLEVRPHESVLDALERAQPARLRSRPHLPPLLPSRVLRDLRLPHQWEGAPRLHDERAHPWNGKAHHRTPPEDGADRGYRGRPFGLLPGTAVRLELPPRERVEPRLRASRRDREAHSVRELYRVRNLRFRLPRPGGVHGPGRPRVS